MRITGAQKRRATRIQEWQLQFSPKKITQMDPKYATICATINASLPNFVGNGHYNIVGRAPPL